MCIFENPSAGMCLLCYFTPSLSLPSSESAFTAVCETNDCCKSVHICIGKYAAEHRPTMVSEFNACLLLRKPQTLNLLISFTVNHRLLKIPAIMMFVLGTNSAQQNKPCVKYNITCPTYTLATISLQACV